MLYSRPMKVAIIGAGIYGCHISLKLAEAGYEVDLIEKESDVLTITTPISLRAHAGYFYARSPETMLSCKENSSLFQQEYPGGVVDGCSHYYVIAKNGSKITGQEFLNVLDKYEFPYTKTVEPLLNQELVDECVLVDEYSYDPDELKIEVKRKLSMSPVKLRLNTDVNQISFADYDLKILTGYASNNDIARQMTGEPIQEYEYRLCEKVIVKLPPAFYKKNFVILDGPFCQIDPYGSKEGVFALSHFLHSIHSRHEGNFFDIDPEERALLGKGVVKNPSITNAPQIIEEMSKFIPEVKKAEIIGSIYAIKPVIPKESTDARPVIVKAIKKDVLAILSGKVSGCIPAAEECLKYAKNLSA
jgi:hypothetical protein